MANTREIQLRIRSITGTQQITRAMKLVSTAKLQRIRGIAEEGRPYFSMVYQTVCSILQASTEDVSQMSGFSQPASAANKPVAYILITSDSGLAGGYNINVCRMLEAQIENKEEALIVTVGKRGRDYFERRGYQMDAHFDNDTEVPQMSEINQIARYVMSLYTEGKVSGVRIAYTMFKNTLNQIPEVIQLFPLDPEDFKSDPKEEKELISMNYEPSPEEVMKRIMPLYLSGILHGAMAEASASEQGARMTAMDSATDNAGDMIDRLTLQYNRARQSHITQELTEIINGAAALE